MRIFSRFCTFMARRSQNNNGLHWLTIALYIAYFVFETKIDVFNLKNYKQKFTNRISFFFLSSFDFNKNISLMLIYYAIYLSYVI